MLWDQVTVQHIGERSAASGTTTAAHLKGPAKSSSEGLQVAQGF